MDGHGRIMRFGRGHRGRADHGSAFLYLSTTDAGWSKLRENRLERRSPMTTPAPSNFLELRHASTDRAIFVVVPERTFFAVDGVGESGASDFRLATSALRTVIDLLLLRLRRAGIETATRAGVVECGWLPPRPLPPADVPAAFRDRSRWHWCQMIELPARATEAHALAAIDEARRGAGRDHALVRRLTFTEGRAAQLLHIGPGSTEPVTVHGLFQAIDEAGLRPQGQLHALLLADADVARQGIGRSILRQPVA
jgi:hypothetical protein